MQCAMIKLLSFSQPREQLILALENTDSLYPNDELSLLQVGGVLQT